MADSLKSPLMIMMKRISGVGKKGSDQPKQTNPNSDEPGGIASEISNIINLLKELKNKLPDGTRPTNDIADVIRKLTILLNTYRGIKPEAKSSEDGEPSQAPLDLQSVVSGDEGGLVSNPSPGGDLDFGSSGMG